MSNVDIPALAKRNHQLARPMLDNGCILEPASEGASSVYDGC